MLKSLLIKDYVLIDRAEVNFGAGLNIITGETGAGKSIIIDAMNLLIGERASIDVIRKGAEKSVIEGVFDITDNKKVKEYLSTNDFEFPDDLIIRREVSVKGSSRCFISDSPATLSNLKDIGSYLIDLHGQHEHQSLLRTETHIDMLDSFGSLGKLTEEYSAFYSKLNVLYKDLKKLKERAVSIREKKDFYSFQLNEIEETNPKENELDDLISKIKILENGEKLSESTQKIYEILYESEFAVYDQLIKVRNILDDLSKIDRFFSELKNENSGVISIIEELSKVVQSYNSRIEYSPDTLEEFRERIRKLNLLVKKYGGSYKSLIQHREMISREINLIDNFDEEIERITGSIDVMIKQCSDAAVRISYKRRETAEKISKSIVLVLKDLGISSPKFEVKIDNIKATGEEDVYVRLDGTNFRADSKGFDKVEFYLSANAGEELKPLTKVASGGEVSRIMLALKTILAKSDRLPMMVFDEIDVGISGRIAQKVGKALKSLANYHQIIAITHLPQIAAFSNFHYVVEKSQKNGITSSRIVMLSHDEKVVEIAKLLSGENLTDSSLSSAKELIGECNK